MHCGDCRVANVGRFSVTLNRDRLFNQIAISLRRFPDSPADFRKRLSGIELIERIFSELYGLDLSVQSPGQDLQNQTSIGVPR
jgi:hypothetical protein